MRATAIALLMSMAPEPEPEKASPGSIAGAVLVAVGIASAVTGGVMVLVGVVGDTEDDGIFRATCTVGKPCGNTCIEVSDTCHIPTGDAGGGYQEHEKVPGSVGIAGVVLAFGGLALATAGTFVLAKHGAPRRQRRLVLTGNGLAVKF